MVLVDYIGIFFTCCNTFVHILCTQRTHAADQSINQSVKKKTISISNSRLFIACSHLQSCKIYTTFYTYPLQAFSDLDHTLFRLFVQFLPRKVGSKAQLPPSHFSNLQHIPPCPRLLRPRYQKIQCRIFPEILPAFDLENRMHCKLPVILTRRRFVYIKHS